MINYLNVLNELIDKYKLTNKEKSKFIHLIMPIFTHDEFQRRMNPDEFAHHDKLSLGYHIISDAIVTYLFAKKQNLSEKSIDTAITIAMFHDLYEIPWQNSGIIKSHFTNKHGFTHPIEAAINAYTWYPKYFNHNADIIIDGIIHHIYPFPVRALDNTPAQLNNMNKFKKLNLNIKNLIVNSSIRFKIGHISLCPSKYIEGRIMSKADKYVSLFSDLKSFHGLKSCITGINPHLDSYQRTRKKR